LTRMSLNLLKGANSPERNIDRFPEDFMFELSREEFKNLRSQIVTSSWGGLRYLPMSFLSRELRCFPVFYEAKEQFKSISR
jgi:hypothetical protein